jgi:peptide/nickel transport system permease protein
MKYLLRRFALYAVAAWASLTLNFFLPRLLPGDPASAMFARLRGQLSPEAMTSLRAAFGLTDQNLWAQYTGYLRHTLSGDLGVSVAYFPQPVSEVIRDGLGWTLLLAGCALILSFFVGSLLGVVAAWRRGGVFDGAASSALTVLGSFPYFWLAMLLLYVFAFKLGWFPLTHAYDDALEPGLRLGFVGSVVRHAFLPAATIVLASMGGWMLGMRNTMLGVLREDYVVFARAKGLPEWRVMFGYAARTALLPNLTGFGMAFGFVVSGSLLTEIVFSYPGQGYLLMQAVRNQDYPLLQGLLLMLTLVVLAANWLVDLLYVLLDPRIRGQEAA